MLFIESINWSKFDVPRKNVLIVMVLEKSNIPNAKELVNYLITEVIRHVQCVVGLQMRLVPHVLAQVEIHFLSHPSAFFLRSSEDLFGILTVDDCVSQMSQL